MVNVAAMALLLNNSRGGLGFGGGRDEDIEDRYSELNAAKGGFRIDGTSVMTAYLDGRCKLTAYGTATDASNLFGEPAQLRNVEGAVAEYKAEAEKRLNMITPPSFLEKVMVLRRSLGYTKGGKALSTSTLGLSSVAAGMISLAARSYGRAKDFVLDKFGEKDKNKQSFSERLSNLKKRVDLKDDLKKLNRLETAYPAARADDKLRYEAKYDRPKATLASSKLLDQYLTNSRAIIRVTKDGAMEKQSWFDTYQEKVPMKDVEETMQKTDAAIKMITPPSGIEKILKAADRLMERRNSEKPVTSSLTHALSAVINKAIDGYVAAKEKKDPAFKGRLSLYGRFAEIGQRRELKKDAVKLRALHQKMTGR